MEYYTKEEKITMIKMYYSGNSYQRVCDIFGGYFPDRPVPVRSTIKRIVDKFEVTGTVINDCTCGIENNVGANRNQENEDLDVLLQVEEKKGAVSTRVLGETVGKDNSTVWRILTKHKYYSYKYQKHQELREGDEIRRADFCFQMMERANNDRHFLKNICFTDECTFTLNNEPNVQNFRYWSRTNENRFVETRTQYPQKVNVWAGIFGQHIIGPYYLNETLTAQVFLELLQNHIGPALTEIVEEDQDIWFQMDGCPAHNSLVVREYLQDVFGGNVIGPGFTTPWPARSPDISPNDFFLWGDLKTKLYTNIKYQNLDELKNRITEECRRYSDQHLEKVRREFYDRLGYCLAVNGGIFEHLIKK